LTLQTTYEYTFTFHSKIRSHVSFQFGLCSYSQKWTLYISLHVAVTRRQLLFYAYVTLNAVLFFKLTLAQSVLSN